MQDRHSELSNGVEQSDTSQAITIEFVLANGETFTVQDFIDGSSADGAIRQLGDQLAAEIGTGRVRTFPYWEGDEFFFDAVRMDQVAAFSISMAAADEENEEE